LECELGGEINRGMRIMVVHPTLTVAPEVLILHEQLWPELIEAGKALEGKSRVQLTTENYDTDFDIDVWACRPDSVSRTIEDWLGYTKFIIAGKNIEFDIGFLKKLKGFDRTFKILPRRLDPVMYYLDEEDQVPPNAFECIKRSGLVIDYPHRAVEDALVVRELIEHGYETRNTN
jgi:hypothetical protein